jgi:hypothetical protein
MNGIPVVNLNGEKAESLVNARIAAREAVQAAMKALGECSPNGRDYQTAPKGEFEIARKVYTERFAYLDKLANELEDEAIAIQNQSIAA